MVYPGMPAGEVAAPVGILLSALKKQHPLLAWLNLSEPAFVEKLIAHWIKTAELEAELAAGKKPKSSLPVLDPTTVALSIYEFKQLRSREGVVLLDSRHGEVFAIGFVPGSLSIGLDGRFIEWAGSLLNSSQEIILVTEPGEEEETCNRLNKAGIFKIHGFLQGGFSQWKKAGETIDILIDVEADELAMDMPHDPKLVVVDVRTEAEFTSGHVVDAVNLPLADMTDPGEIAMLPEDGNWYLHCGGHYRSIIAASLLKRQGLHNLRFIKGGWDSIKEQKDIKTEVEKSALN